MAKKTSGLGRGLGDLFEDNTPEIRPNSSGTVVRKESEKKAEPVPASTSTPTSVSTPTSDLYKNTPPKSLYEQKHKNKSLKANFKNFNR